MIKGVVTKQLTRHHDERGYFQENIRVTDDFFSEGFGQWSESEMYQGVIKAWHVHWCQVDWWRCSGGIIKVVLCDLREFFDVYDIASLEDLSKFNNILKLQDYWSFDASISFSEYILGLPDDPYILKIPPPHSARLQGVARAGHAILHYQRSL